MLVLSVVPRAQVQFELLHAFTGGTDDVANSYADLLEASDGNFYGTAYGGLANQGTLFKMTPDGTVAVLHEFTGYPDDGASPDRTKLVEGTDGNFYGTTQFGGSIGVGTILQMTPEGNVTILYSFTGGADGRLPETLMQAGDGNFYGTTLQRGAFGGGTVFMMTPDGVVSILHAFDVMQEGMTPYGRLIQATDGNLYGTTTYGSDFGRGAVFQMITDGTADGTTVTVLHAFFGFPDDGAYPVAALIQATDGNFYGTTANGGSGDHDGAHHGYGTVFRMTPDGTVSVLHSFTGGVDGETPAAGLLAATDGNFYGTTERAGLGFGTLFQITPTGDLSVFYAFTGGDDGAIPAAALIQATDGRLYGTTVQGGASRRFGTAFRLILDDTAILGTRARLIR